MGSQSELYYMRLSKKSGSLKEKRKKKIHTHTNNKLLGQFSYKPKKNCDETFL